MATDVERTAFLKAAIWHGKLEPAEQMLAAHPDLAAADIHCAAVLGDETVVRQLIAEDPARVHAKSPPYDGDALNYLCLSKYLRLDPSRGESFLRTATVLLDAGADPNTGFWLNGEHETALYGAAGVAHHGDLTRLLISRGADPNDPEVVYHTPEDWDMEALRAVVETGRLTNESLALMLLRKHDWHHAEGAQYLLEHGAAPNFSNDNWQAPLQHAILRDNDLPIIELLLQHGADFNARHPKVGTSALGLAARRGRSDILELLIARGQTIALQGVEELLAACALRDAAAVERIARESPQVVAQLVAEGGKVLAEFTGNDNTGGVRLLLDIGVPVDARFEKGDGYWGIASDSTALHMACWRLCHETARLLIERGADVNAKNQKGQTPLQLAIMGCVDSYWTEWRKPDTITALLAAGASTEGVRVPTGYDEADALLTAHVRR
jgi:ankyrin repeat protein